MGVREPCTEKQKPKKNCSWLAHTGTAKKDLVYSTEEKLNLILFSNIECHLMWLSLGKEFSHTICVLGILRTNSKTYRVWLAVHLPTDTEGHSYGYGTPASGDLWRQLCWQGSGSLTILRFGWLSPSHGTLLLGFYLWPLTRKTFGCQRDLVWL